MGTSVGTSVGKSSPVQSSTGQSSAGYHRIASFMRCPQLFAFREVLGLVPRIEGEATGVGTVLHEAIHAHYLHESAHAALEQLPARYAPHVARGRELFLGYVERWPRDRDGFHVLGVEQEYRVDLDGRPFTRRLDLVVEQRGRVVVLDHKTASKPAQRAQTAPDDWALLTQEVVGRAVLPAATGLAWGGVVLDLVGSGSERYYERVPLSFAPRMVEAAPRSILYYYRAVEALAEAGADPWRYPRTGQCRSGFKCDYLPLCEGGSAWVSQYDREGVRGL